MVCKYDIRYLSDETALLLGEGRAAGWGLAVWRPAVRHRKRNAVVLSDQGASRAPLLPPQDPRRCPCRRRGRAGACRSCCMPTSPLSCLLCRVRSGRRVCTATPAGAALRLRDLLVRADAACQVVLRPSAQATAVLVLATQPLASRPCCVDCRASSQPYSAATTRYSGLGALSVAATTASVARLPGNPGAKKMLLKARRRKHGDYHWRS